LAVNALIFDTHEFVKTLSEAGLPVSVAEALASEQAKILDRQDRDLVTKADLEALKGWVRGELQALEYRFELRLQETITTLQKRIDERFATQNDNSSQNFGSLVAKMDQRFEQVDQGSTQQEERFDQKLESLKAKMDQRFAQVDQRFTQQEERFD